MTVGRRAVTDLFLVFGLLLFSILEAAGEFLSFEGLGIDFGVFFVSWARTAELGKVRT